MRIGLVGCGKAKLSHAAPAKDLYTSTLFRLAREYAEETCDRWFILSAKHGLVDPDSVLEPYELPMAALGRLVPGSPRDRWSVKVVAQLRALGLTLHQFVLLAGSDYGDGLRGLLMEEPLDGMQIGERMHWLKAKTAAAKRGGTPVDPARELAGQVLEMSQLRERAERAERQADRLRHGHDVEGDGVCPNLERAERWERTAAFVAEKAECVAGEWSARLATDHADMDARIKVAERERDEARAKLAASMSLHERAMAELDRLRAAIAASEASAAKSVRCGGRP
jgi:phage gp16-like protein